MTRPSAKQIAREFKGGCSLDWLVRKYSSVLMLGEVEAAIRKYVFPGGRNGR